MKTIEQLAFESKLPANQGLKLNLESLQEQYKQGFESKLPANQGLKLLFGNHYTIGYPYLRVNFQQTKD